MSSETNSLPMPTPTNRFRGLTAYKVLAFDIYGTLIDWETSILAHLQPLLTHLPADSPYHDQTALAARYNHHEHALQTKHPAMLYRSLIRQAYVDLALDLGIRDLSAINADADSFGESIGSWRAFPDTVDAMVRLGKHYKLIALSNVDRESFAGTCAGPLAEVPFWRAYVAQDIGTYKPDLRNFEYLIQHANSDAKLEEEQGGKPDEERKGVVKDEILMVAQSLMHDHVPAKKAGLSSVWVNRAGAGMGNADGVKEVHERGEVGYAIRVGTLGELADLVDEAWEKEGK